MLLNGSCLPTQDPRRRVGCPRPPRVQKRCPQRLPCLNVSSDSLVAAPRVSRPVVSVDFSQGWARPSAMSSIAHVRNSGSDRDVQARTTNSARSARTHQGSQDALVVLCLATLPRNRPRTSWSRARRSRSGQSRSSARPESPRRQCRRIPHAHPGASRYGPHRWPRHRTHHAKRTPWRTSCLGWSHGLGYGSRCRRGSGSSKSAHQGAA